MPLRRLLTLSTTAALLLAAVADAAAPKPDARYMVHDHQTPGDEWHVDAKTAKDGKSLSTLVVSARRCGSFTPFTNGVPVDADGNVSYEGPLNPRSPEVGTWSISAIFTAPHRLDGSFRMVTPTCDTGPMLFSAHSGKAGKHSHGRSTMSGTPMGTMPDLSKAKPRRLRQVRRLYRESLRAARIKYRTYGDALRAGFVRYSSNDEMRQLFHVRSREYAYDDVWFNARKVESLVYYRRSDGTPILVGFMFRAPLGGQPAFGKPVLGWHSHGTPPKKPKRLLTQMTHVWLTGDLRSGLANCMPVAQLEAFNPEFKLEPGSIGLGHESKPCPPDA